MKNPSSASSTKMPNNVLTQNVLLAQSGDEAALERVLMELSGMVRGISRSYYFIGADHDDVIQEGMIGLFLAVMNFDTNRHTNFKIFAQTCITNRIAAAVKTAARKKHSPLNYYVSMGPGGPDETKKDRFLELIANDSLSDPESLIIRREDDRLARNDLEKLLTSLEQSVLICYLEGMAHKEISVRLGKTQKSVGNAIFRVKKKLQNYYAESHK